MGMCVYVDACCLMVLFCSDFSCFEKFLRCRTDFLSLYFTVEALYFFFMPYNLKIREGLSALNVFKISVYSKLDN